MAARPAAEARPWATSWAATAGLLLALGILALVVRVPNYQLMPAFTDELDDIDRAFQIAQGRSLPLIDETSPYNGSLWNVLLAAALRLSGNSLYAPRTLILLLGASTVVVTYALGRAWGGRLGGLIAATLLGTAANHVLVNSHIAWSNCLTPLFTTLAIWTLYEAVQGRTLRPATALLLSGFLWGLALQTHPSVLALLVGAAFYLLCKGRSLLASRWLFPAAGLFLLANLNLIVYNVSSEFDSVVNGVGHSIGYAQYEPLTAPLYLSRLAWLLLGLFQYLGGAVDFRESVALFLLDPGLWPITLAAAAGVLWQWRRGNTLPGLLLLSMALVVPIFNARLAAWVPWPLSMTNSRYLAPLLPVLYAGVGSIFASAAARVCSAGYRGGWWPVGRLTSGCLALVAAFLVLHPLSALRTYYDQALKQGWTNAPLFATVEQIRASRRADEIIVVDAQFRRRKTGQMSGKLDRAMEVALTLSQVPFRLADLSSDDLLDPTGRCRDQLVVRAFRDPAAVDRLGLRPLDEGPAAPTRVGGFPIYRLDRLPGAPTGC